MIKKCNKIVSFALSVTVLLSAMYGVFVLSNKHLAEKNDEPSLEKINSKNLSHEEVSLGIDFQEAKTKILSREEVPLGIDYEEAIKEGHKSRLYDQEPNDHRRTDFFLHKNDMEEWIIEYYLSWRNVDY